MLFFSILIFSDFSFLFYLLVSTRLTLKGLFGSKCTSFTSKSTRYFPIYVEKNHHNIAIMDFFATRCKSTRKISRLFLPLSEQVIILLFVSTFVDAANFRLNTFDAVVDPTTPTTDSFYIADRKENSIGRFKRTALSDSADQFVPVDEVQILKNRVKQLEDQVKKLNSTSADDGDKTRILTLTSDLENVRRALDNANQNIQDIAARINSLTNEISALTQKFLPEQCAAEIENGRFEAAEEKLRQIGDDDKENVIVQIVRWAYMGRNRNFQRLLNFGKFVKDLRSKLIIFDAITNEMQDNKNRESADVDALIDAVKTEISDRYRGGYMKEKADTLLHELNIWKNSV